jgi:hypothetical protein
MKKLSIAIVAGTVILLASSCQKYLDINHNPNSALTSTPEAVLPETIVSTATQVSSYNDYGAQLVGYMANAGGYGGFGSNWTYNFGPNDYSGLWTGSYNALEDCQYIINSARGDSSHAYFEAAARVLKAYNFQALVDAYNSVPYFNALKGQSAPLSPTYDDPKVIYQDLALQLDTAIALINTATTPALIPLTAGEDPLFGGNMTSWKQFANTIKLRLMIRAFGIINFTDPTFDAAGFLTTDAIVNPGFQKATGQQNPSWNTWVQSYTGTNGNRAWMAATFVVSYYDGTKLADNRGYAIYYNFPGAYANQLGDGASTVPSAPATTNAWYCSYLQGTNILPNVGVMKGPNMGEPIMLAAESYFLQAEGVLKSLITGDVPTLFNSGIQASFTYLYETPDLNVDFDFSDPVADFAQYQSDNAASPLVNLSLATTPAQQLEAIITQKYIALNMINSGEAWNEFRRTHYPATTPDLSDPNATFASTQSQSSRPDKLPTRILYPATETSYNEANVPTGISPYTSTIFWAQ